MSKIEKNFNIIFLNCEDNDIVKIKKDFIKLNKKLIFLKTVEELLNEIKKGKTSVIILNDKLPKLFEIIKKINRRNNIMGILPVLDKYDSDKILKITKVGVMDYVVKDNKYYIDILYEKIKNLYDYNKKTGKTNKSINNLQKDMNNFKNMFMNHLAIMLLIDPKTGSIVNANKSAEKFYGWSIDQLKRMKIQDINIISSNEGKKKLESLKTGEKNHSVFYHRCVDNSVREVKVLNSLINIDGEEYIHSIVYDYDIAYENRYDEKILRKTKNSHSKKNSLLKSIINVYGNFYIFSIDRKYRFTFFTKNFENMIKRDYKYSINVGMNILDIIRDPKKKKKIKKNFDRALKGEEFVYVEQYNIKKSEDTFWEITFSPIYNEKNKISGITVFFMDITKRMLAEKALVESETRYKSIFVNDKMIMIIVDFKTQRIIDVSPGAEKFYGWSKDEFTKLKISFINTLGEKETRKRMMKLRKEKVNRLEFIHRKKDGSICEVEIIRGDIKIGKQDVFYLIINDISERKKAEKALMENERKLRAITNSARDAIVMINNKDEIMFWNPAAEKTFGYKLEETVGKKLHSFIVPNKYHKAFQKGFRAFTKTGKGNAIDKISEITALRKNGEEFSVSLSVSAVLIDDKWHAVGIIRDVSKEKKSEEELRKSREIYRLITENTADTITVFDLNLNYLYISPSVKKTLGYTPEELSEKNLEEIIIPEDLKMLKKVLSEEIVLENIGRVSKNKSKVLEIREIRKDGVMVWTESTVSFLMDSNNKPIGILSVSRDITERKKAEEALKESEKYNKILFHDSHIPLVVMDSTTYEFLDCNMSAVKIYGFKKREDVLGKTPADVSTKTQYNGKSSKKIAAELIKEALKKERIIFEWRHKRPNGEVWDGEVQLMSFKYKGKKLLQFSLLDITERKKMQRKLRESESKYRAAFQTSPDALAITTMQGDYIDVNNGFTNITGYARDEIIGKNTDDLRIWKNKQNRKRFLKILKEKGFVDNYEAKFRTKDGRILIGLMSAKLIYFNNTPRLLTITRDITDRKNMEEALKESESKYRIAFQTSPDALTITSLDGYFIDVNDGFIKGLEYAREEIIGKHAKELNIWKNMDDMEKYLKSLREKGFVDNLEAEFLSKKGKTITGLMSSRILKFNNQLRVISIIRNITDRKKIEQAIEMERERLIVTLRSIGDGVITTDIKGRIILMNKVAEKLTGWSQKEAKGKELKKVFNIINEHTGKRINDPVKKVLNSGRIIEIPAHSILVSRDGSKIVIADSGAPIKDKNSNTIGVVLVFRDVTEKQKLLEASQKNQKLEALGILAGGIAHDFNNLLTGIYGYIDMSYRRSEDDLVSKYLKKTISTIDKARNLTQQLLTFSKGGAPVKKVDYLFPFIEETVKFILSGSNINVEYDIAKNLWSCEYDKNQIGQVIDNMIINAKQAMPSGGIIKIKAENISIVENKIGILEKGNYIKISIEDNGIGIPSKVISHIFDPFFTTKEEGHGLGLATCYSIINRHGGEILVESEQERGTVFHIYLPASQKTVRKVQKTEFEKHKGKGDILIMDDDEILRDTLKNMLEECGYNVITTTKGEEVIEYLTNNNKIKLRAIILDLTITGGMGGKETIQEIRKTYKKIPVFVASGYASDPILAYPEKYGFTASIGKPFLLSELSQLLIKHL